MMNYREYVEGIGVDTFDLDERDFLILCPFHRDSDPSCSVHIEEGVFYCFSCKESGNFAKLISKLEDISLEEAKGKILQGDRIEYALRNALKVITSDYEEEEFKYYSVKSFHNEFPTVFGTPGHEYLKGRGLTDATIKRFDLRWGTFDEWRDRVIIPVYDERGRLVTYTGRTILKDVHPKTRRPRTGRSTLFGIYPILGKFTGDKFSYVTVVEGEFDVMWSQQCKIRAVSTMGTASLTGKQKALFIKYFKLAILSYDGDDAGKKATIKAAPEMRAFMPTLVAQLPDGKDPDDMAEADLRLLYKNLMEGVYVK